MKSKGEILSEILTEFQDCYIFLHNTRNEEIAEKIINEGFLFESQLPHSTDRINPLENVEINYFFIQRKDYGSYTIVIAIPKSTYSLYSEASEEFEKGIEEVITASEPYTGDNDESVYRLSPAHILGYFNSEKGEFIRNRSWDPAYNNLTSDQYRQRTD
jgi:hypothetical protein